MRRRGLLILLALACAGSLWCEDWKNPAERHAEAYKAYLGAQSPIPVDGISNFVYFARDRAAMRGNAFLDNPSFAGAQIMYPWALVEPERGSYDFSMIRDDYEFLKARHKRLFVQLQDASFDPSFNPVPAYLMSRDYDGGAVYQRGDDGKPEGWVAKRWSPRVRERFALLLEAMGRELDGKIEGINLQETAIGVSAKDDPSFSGPVYAAAVKANMLAMKRAFPSSVTMQYANFMSEEWLPWDDKGYLRSVYEYGERIGVGLGGPDLIFTRKAQLNHTIAMMHEGSFTVPLGIAVQDGNYIGETGTASVEKRRENLVPALHAFAKGFLHVSYIFWSNQEPYFSEDVLRAFPAVR